MYLRAAHAETHIPSLRNFIRENPLGIFTTAIPSPNYPLLQCTHIPWILDVSDESSETELGVLRGHMARANPHSKAIIDHLSNDGNSAQNQIQEDVMILFNGPAQHYITPKFYVKTKPATGKVVPTWNYSAAQAYGKATIFFDSSAASTISFLSRQVEDLTKHSEAKVMGFQTPWKVDDAPQRYVELLRKSIIGIEVRVERLEGKFKMSQEMGKADREGVIRGFEGLGTELGMVMAETVKGRGELKDRGKGEGER
jgi:transcriptional regulator